MQTESLNAQNINSNDITVSNLTVSNSFTNNSDRRLKKDIKDLDIKYKNIIDKIHAKEFSYKKTEEKRIGFIAQDVEKAFLSENMECPIIKKNEIGIYSMDYTQLIPILWKAIQEQQEQIEKLKQRLEEK